MSLVKRIYFGITAVCLMVGFTVIAPVSADYSPQKDNGEKSKKQKEDKDKKDDKKDKKADQMDSSEDREGRPVLWREPTDIESRDLFNGPGGPQSAPDPSGRFTFQKRSSSGTSEKIIVEDDQKREWTVKFGAESRPETAATRIVWAAG